MYSYRTPVKNKTYLNSFVPFKRGQCPLDTCIEIILSAAARMKDRPDFRRIRWRAYRTDIIATPKDVSCRDTIRRQKRATVAAYESQRVSHVTRLRPCVVLSNGGNTRRPYSLPLNNTSEPSVLT